MRGAGVASTCCHRLSLIGTDYRRTSHHNPRHPWCYPPLLLGHIWMNCADRCRPMKPLHFAANPLQPISQQLWADAVYVKDMWELGQSQDSGGCGGTSELSVSVRNSKEISWNLILMKRLDGCRMFAARGRSSS